MRAPPIAVIALLSFAGCKSPDAAYKQDVQTICDGPSLTEKKAPGVMAKMDPSQQARLIGQVVTEQLKTDRGKTFLRSTGNETKGPADKASMMSAEAKSVGISTCEWADWWQKFAKK